MVGLRKNVCYRKVKRAYTRYSKYKRKSYIKARPNNKVVKFEVGDPKKNYTHKVHLIVKEAIQIRDNSLEASRLLVGRHLAKELGENNFFLQVKVYPHHVLRENKLLTGAGADRMQTGMSHAFGVPVGLAAQLRKNQPVFTVKVEEANVQKTKECLKFAMPRLSGKFLIISEKI